MPEQTSVGRNVVMIVLAGATLGLLHNGVGLATRPPRGIPWIARETAPQSLESLTSGGAPTAVPSGDVQPADAGSTSPPGAPPATSGAGVGTVARPNGSTPVSHPKGAADADVSTRPTQGAAPTSGVSDPPRAAPLPFIPTSGAPIKMEIATVKRFFDARGALFLDARDPAEYEAGHIPGALRLTNVEAQGEPDRLKNLPVQGRPIIAYCEGGECEASMELARTLIEAGYPKVLVYLGGYPEWSAAGYPVERGSGGR
jgi:rhodanese-related sulfurtransferase